MGLQWLQQYPPHFAPVLHPPRSVFFFVTTANDVVPINKEYDHLYPISSIDFDCFHFPLLNDARGGLVFPSSLVSTSVLQCSQSYLDLRLVPIFFRDFHARKVGFPRASVLSTESCLPVSIVLPSTYSMVTGDVWKTFPAKYLSRGKKDMQPFLCYALRALLKHA